MKTLAQGIAHISFPGGGLFLPARNPYDLQMLAEHVADRARAKGQVQVLLGSMRWMVQSRRGPSTARCSQCGGAAEPICYSTVLGVPAQCVACAFTLRTPPASMESELQTHVG